MSSRMLVIATAGVLGACVGIGIVWPSLGPALAVVALLVGAFGGAVIGYQAMQRWSFDSL